jgi:hypothetical protein
MIVKKSNLRRGEKSSSLKGEKGNVGTVEKLLWKAKS